MKDIKELERIGLSHNERKVYLSLIDLGNSPASNVVKQTGLARPYVYDIFGKLINYGLVNFIIKNNKKYFSTSDPEKIIDILNEKKRQIEEDEKILSKEVKSLKIMQNQFLEKQQAKIYLGKEGLKSILEDVLRSKTEFYVYGAEGLFRKIFKIYFSNWQLRRVEKKIHYKIIYGENLRSQRPLKEQKLVKIKYLPSAYEFPATTIVYNKKTAIIIWDDEPMGFFIESKKVNDSFKSSFDIMWKLAKK